VGGVVFTIAVVGIFTADTAGEEDVVGSTEINDKPYEYVGND
jgi:hypothetical protein